MSQRFEEHRPHLMGVAYHLTEIGRIVGRHEVSCRQLLARARRHVRERAPRFTPEPAQHRTAVTAFLRAAAAAGRWSA